MTDETSGQTAQDTPPHRRHREGQQEAASSRPRGLLHALREVVTVAAIALVISFLIKTFLVQAFWIPSGSMEDTLRIGDRVLVSKIQAGPLAVDRGDIIVFEDPGGWLPSSVEVDRSPVMDVVVGTLEFVGLAPTAQGNHLIKRVIGTEGDSVACCDDQGRLTVNDQPLEEDYLYPGDVPSEQEFDVVVPQDSLWMMGDHRSNSRDSRANDDGTGAAGAVPVENVVGQAAALVWPLGRADWFDVPATWGQVPAP